MPTSMRRADRGMHVKGRRGPNTRDPEAKLPAEVKHDRPDHVCTKACPLYAGDSPVGARPLRIRTDLAKGTSIDGGSQSTHTGPSPAASTRARRRGPLAAERVPMLDLAERVVYPTGSNEERLEDAVVLAERVRAQAGDDSAPHPEAPNRRAQCACDHTGAQHTHRSFQVVGPYGGPCKAKDCKCPGFTKRHNHRSNRVCRPSCPGYGKGRTKTAPPRVPLRYVDAGGCETRFASAAGVALEQRKNIVHNHGIGEACDNACPVYIAWCSGKGVGLYPVRRAGR